MYIVGGKTVGTVYLGKPRSIARWLVKRDSVLPQYKMGKLVVVKQG